MNDKFSPDLLLKTIAKKITELKQMIKRYPSLSFDLHDLEYKVNREVHNQLKIPETERVHIPVRKQRVLAQSPQERDKKQIEEEFFNNNATMLQYKKFKNEYKKWLQDFIIILNQIRSKNKELNVKRIIEPFVTLEIIKNASFKRKEIIAKVMEKIKDPEDKAISELNKELDDALAKF